MHNSKNTRKIEALHLSRRWSPPLRRKTENDDAVTRNGGQAREEVDRERKDDESYGFEVGEVRRMNE